VKKMEMVKREFKAITSNLPYPLFKKEGYPIIPPFSKERLGGIIGEIK